MQYFNHGYIDFLQQLHQNNNSDWFRDNKKWYELAVRGPFKSLVSDLLPEIRKLDPDIDMEPRDALFRINRDLRFSKNQSPYHTHMAAGFTREGKKSSMAGYYLQVGRNFTAIGGGLPYVDPETLRKIRIGIGYRAEEFKKIIDDKSFKNTYGALLGEPDRNLPRSFHELAKTQPAIAKKQLYYVAFYRTEEILFREDLPRFIIGHFSIGARLNSFLINAVTNFSRPLYQRSPRKILEY